MALCAIDSWYSCGFPFIKELFEIVFFAVSFFFLTLKLKGECRVLSISIITKVNILYVRLPVNYESAWTDARNLIVHLPHLFKMFIV